MKIAKRKLGARKRIALVAHDHKKLDLIDWAVFNKDVLAKHELFATGTTGKLLEDALDRPVKKLLSGPLGGDQQIGSMIATGELDMLVFFSDPMETQPHDSDVRALQRISSTWNVPMASNRSSADFLMTSRFMNEEYEILIPNYDNYLQRKF